MDIRSTRLGLGAATLVILAGTTVAGDAIDLVSTGSPSRFGVADRANLDGEGIAINLVQRIVIPTDAEISTISFFGSATGADLYLTDMVGTGATDTENILWETHGLTTSGSKSWRDIDATGLSLEAGTYYLVMASDTTSGGLWSRVSRVDTEALNVEARGNGTYVKVNPFQTVASLNYSFQESDTLGYAVRITGTAGEVPAPGSLALLGAGGLLAARRRRR